MEKRIIVYYPFYVDLKRHSASQMRPLKMVEAFESLGYNVDTVYGYAKNRQRIIKDILYNIYSGVKYQFLYTESSTMPTLLTEKDHMPLHPCFDFSFFKECKKHGIPIGLFYRDIYWTFIKNRSLKEWVAYLFYQYDLRKYNRLIDILFLPSIEMLRYIPNIRIQSIIPLPPGAPEVQQMESSDEKYINDEKIRILYVGGIGNHYDLKLMMNAVAKFSEIEFIICCRESDWIKVKADYTDLLAFNINIVHQDSDKLENLYNTADYFAIFVKPFIYWDFAVPYKLFEAIGHGLPIISTKGTWVGKYVADKKIGFSVNYNLNDISEVLKKLKKKPTKKHIIDVAEKNTWKDRAYCVESNLLNLNSNN